MREVILLLIVNHDVEIKNIHLSAVQVYKVTLILIQKITFFFENTLKRILEISVMLECS